VNKFEIVTPASLADASKLLAQKDHIAIAGGVDVVDLLKLNLVAPKTIVNLKGLKELDGIQTDSKGLRLGALTKLHAVATHSEIRERYTAIAEAAAEAATRRSEISGPSAAICCSVLDAGTSVIRMFGVSRKAATNATRWRD